MKERLFIAIPAEIDKFEAIKNSFEHLVTGKYSLEEQLHLTVVFIGDLLNEEEIIERLQDVDLGFEVSAIVGLGYFNQSRVLVGLCQNDSIRVLRERICNALGFECSDEYHLHVTLMRVKKIIDIERFNTAVAESTAQIGTLQKRLILYRSSLTPQGAQYIPLKEFEI